MPGMIHQNDIGTELVLAVVDEDGTAVDVSSATRTIYLKKPDGTVQEEAGATDAEATNYMKYTTIADDLDQIGEWRIQGKVVISGSTWSTTVHNFTVYPLIYDSEA